MKLILSTYYATSSSMSVFYRYLSNFNILLWYKTYSFWYLTSSRIISSSSSATVSNISSNVTFYFRFVGSEYWGSNNTQNPVIVLINVTSWENFSLSPLPSPPDPLSLSPFLSREQDSIFSVINKLNYYQRVIIIFFSRDFFLSYLISTRSNYRQQRSSNDLQISRIKIEQFRFICTFQNWLTGRCIVIWGRKQAKVTLNSCHIRHLLRIG